MSPRCSQCNRAAMYEVEGHLLCLEHQTMLANNARATMAALAADMNYNRDRINEVFGLPPSGTRYEVPQPVINTAPTTHNHISVDRSAVGSINTAQVGRINVAMQSIQNNGNQEVEQAIKALTEAVVNDKGAAKEAKDAAVDALAYLAEQAALPEAQRQRSVIKMVVQALPTTLEVIANASLLWTQWGPAIEGFFKHAL